MIKKVMIIFSLLVCLLPSFLNCERVFATETDAISEENMVESIEKQVEEMDLASLEEFYQENIDFDGLEGDSLTDVIKGMISGEQCFGFNEILDVILGGFEGNLKSVLELVTLIVVIVGFGAFSEMLKNRKKGEGGVSSVINYLILTLILAIVASIVSDFVSETVALLSKIKELMQLIFPILLSLIITVGGSSLGTSLQPVAVVLSSGVTEFVSSLTTVVISVYLVLSVIGELTDLIKLDRLKSFLSSTYKWVIGLIFTIFMGYLSLNGILASGKDGISIKTAKYALRSYLPLVGGYVSDSYELFRAGSVLIKNSVGVIGVVLLFGLVAKRVITLIVYNLGFKLASGLTEPFGMSKVSRFLSSLSTLFNFMIAGIVACFLLVFLTIIIFMSSANL